MPVKQAQLGMLDIKYQRRRAVGSPILADERLMSRAVEFDWDLAKLKSCTSTTAWFRRPRRPWLISILFITRGVLCAFSALSNQHREHPF